MRSSGRRSRWLAVLVGGVALAVAAGDGALIVVGRAAQDDTQAVSYGIYNGQVAAAADREQVATENDVGFSGGAVNNLYPLAQVDVAVAGTSAVASPADTGPLAQAVLGGQNVVQPQYVRAQFPGTENPPAYSAGPANATASVTPASATALATYGAVGNTTTAPVGSPADGSDGGTASARSYFDSTLGLVTIGDSRVHHASYGGGMLTLDDVHVTVQVSTKGSDVFAKTISVTVGSAFVDLNGTQVPVTIDQNGVTVAQPVAPLDVLQQVSGTVNQALASAGITVHTVAPQVTQDGDDLHVEAEGVVVNVQQTGTPEGVPKQSVRHTLGEVVVDNEAVAAPPEQDTTVDTGTPDLGTPPAPVTNTTVITSVGGATAPPPPAAAATAPPASAPARPASVPVSVIVTTPSARRWLLPAYLAWQALMIALVGALYLHRSARRRAP